MEPTDVPGKDTVDPYSTDAEDRYGPVTVTAPVVTVGARNTLPDARYAPVIPARSVGA
jgi:hypothetical protein